MVWSGTTSVVRFDSELCTQAATTSTASFSDMGFYLIVGMITLSALAFGSAIGFCIGRCSAGATVEEPRVFSKRTVSTQSMTTYRRKLCAPRIEVVDEYMHRACSRR